MAYATRGRHWEEFTAGEVIESPGRTVGEGDVATFAGLSGDHNPLHTDEEWAKKTPLGTRIAHGMLTLSISTGQHNQTGVFEGTTVALLGFDKVKFTAPVKFGDTIHTLLTVREKRESSKPDRGVVLFDVAVQNQRGEAVCTYEAAVLMRRRVG